MAQTLHHAAVGNGQILGLVAPDTNIEWLCLPRFDSPSVFGSILDAERGGSFRVRLLGQGALDAQAAYLPDTNVLRTTLRRGDCTVVVEDFCPIAADGARPPAWVRRVLPVSGSPTVVLALDARPDYGRARSAPEWVVRSNAPLDEGFELTAPAVVTLAWGAPLEIARVDALRCGTVEAWAAFVARLPLGLPGWAVRSALALALHVYDDTGAIIAASTTSIPEAVGEPRNWDYRYAWVRDGSFCARALTRAGHPDLGARFLTFLERTIGEGPIQPLYRVDGGCDIPESELPHLRGFADTTPVRIGNAAAGQTQNDAFGQIVWLAHAVYDAGQPLSPSSWRWLAHLVEEADRVALAPDCGVWEFRDRPGRYTFSALWCWVALDRGSRLARVLEDDRAQRWSERAQALRTRILRALEPVGFLAQSLDTDHADASSLVAAWLGFVTGDDPIFGATIARCERDLVQAGLMKRYVAHDDFGHTTSTFGLCTLWWVDALRRAGRWSEADSVLAGFLLFANPHGLFSEDIDPADGRLLGNFPQVYTHCALLELAVDGVDGRTRVARTGDEHDRSTPRNGGSPSVSWPGTRSRCG